MALPPRVDAAAAARDAPVAGAAALACLVEFLAARAVPGVEEVVDGVYRRTIAGGRVIGLGAPEAAPILGADPGPADAHLGRDPVLGPLVVRRPGLRVPGTVDGGELAIRAVIGQQISVAAARTIAGRLVAIAGRPLPEPVGTLTHVWPSPAAIAEAAPALPMPRSRRRTVAALAEAVAGGLRLERGGDARAELLALPGIGPWTAEYIAMRALGDPDAWMPTDLGVRHGLARLGVGAGAADSWRPYRAHAVMHLWSALSDP
ncbi:MAG TPA: AlkA N-terminal domain-containing protein [Solirubrobacteraceae bacterium]|nr:AlkA N-terminal domain-containing protein [Solirubrobacteraceae bacterium]